MCYCYAFVNRMLMSKAVDVTNKSVAALLKNSKTPAMFKFPHRAIHIYARADQSKQIRPCTPQPVELCNEIQLKQNTKPISVFRQTIQTAQERDTENSEAGYVHSRVG